MVGGVVGIGEARDGLLYDTKFWREKFLVKQYTPKIGGLNILANAQNCQSA